MHVVHVCQDFLNQNHIRVHPWPALSPDLSPIAHIWDELGRGVRHRQNPPETPPELRDALVHEWNNMTQAFIQLLIGSMRRRCEAVIAARGGHTRYWTPQTSILHDNFCLSMLCSDNDVEKFCWYCLICYAHINIDYTIFVDFFSLCKKILSIKPLYGFFCWLVYLQTNLAIQNYPKLNILKLTHVTLFISTSKSVPS
jgi:hypothetical protein